MIPCSLTLLLPSGEHLDLAVEVSPNATAWADLERLTLAPIYPEGTRLIAATVHWPPYQLPLPGNFGVSGGSVR